ncbi:hypothetical protein ACTFIW_007304 [Dictyostelium discoideum]
MENNINDKLFFKIFRNIFIKKNIFKFLRNRDIFLGFYRYEDIISCEWCVQFEYYELLKDKIQRGEYLDFSNSSDTIFRNKLRKQYDNGRMIVVNKFSIFNKQISTKAQWNSSNFYYHLFKNYSKYFIDNGNIIQCEYISIEYDNVQCLEALVTYHNHCFSLDSLYRSIEVGSYDCALFIFQVLKRFGPLEKPASLYKIWSMVLFSSNNKNTNILNKNGYLLNERLNFLLNQCNLNVPSSEVIYKQKFQFQCKPYHLFDILVYDQTLSVLIESVKSIIHLKEFLKPYTDSISKKSFKYNKFHSTDKIKSYKKSKIIKYEKDINEQFNDKINLFNSTDEINILTKSFTKEQLNTLVLEFNSSDDDNNNINYLVKRFYQFILPFVEFKSSYFNDSFLFYKIKYESYYGEELDSSSKFHPCLFGIYDFNKIKNEGLKMFGKLTIFYYCKNERSKQIQFIKDLISDVKKLQKSTSLIENSINQILLNLIFVNDLELVKLLLIDSNIEFKFTNEPLSIGRIYRSINSTEMIDLIIKNKTIYSIICTRGNNVNFSLVNTLIQDGKSELLKHLKLLQPNIYYVSIKDLVHKGNYSEISMDVIKFIYDNINDFDYDSMNIWHFTPSTHGYQFTNLNDFKYILERTPSNVNYLYNNYNQWDSVGIFSYIFNHRPFDIESGRCNIMNPKYNILFNYLRLKQTNGIDHISLPQFLGSSKDFNDFYLITSLEIGLYGNLWFADLIIKSFDEGKMSGHLPFYLLKIISIYGQLNVFKHLQSNYQTMLNNLFKERNDSRDANSNTIFFTSVQMGHIDLVLEFFKNPFLKTLPKITNYQSYLLNSSSVTSNNVFLLNYFKLYKPNN